MWKITYAAREFLAAFGLHSWSVTWRCRKQKFNLQKPHWTGTSSFFLHPLNEHLLVNIFVLSDLQYWSMCWPTVISGDIPRGVGTGSPHKGHAGTWTSFLCADKHLCFWYEKCSELIQSKHDDFMACPVDSYPSIFHFGNVQLSIDNAWLWEKSNRIKREKIIRTSVKLHGNFKIGQNEIKEKLSSELLNTL